MVLLKTSNNAYKLPAIAETVISLIEVAQIALGGGSITKNQIEYFKVLESRRANQAQERLTEIRDQANIALGNRNATENERSNRERENQNRLSLDETARHNIQTETLDALRSAETNRHNLATEQLNLSSLEEQIRSNKVKEEETLRSNQARESLQLRSQIEQERENALKDSIALDTLAENVRSNRANEANRAGTLALGFAQLEEQKLQNQRYNSLQEQSNELREREIEDRYFWSDKANQLLTTFFGEGENFNEKAEEVGYAVSKGVDDFLNTAEATWYKTKWQAQQLWKSFTNKRYEKSEGGISGKNGFEPRRLE